MQNSLIFSMFNRSSEYSIVSETFHNKVSTSLGNWMVNTIDLDTLFHSDHSFPIAGKVSCTVNQITSQSKFKRNMSSTQQCSAELFKTMYDVEQLINHPIFQQALSCELTKTLTKIHEPFSFSVGIAKASNASRIECGLMISPRAYLKYTSVMSEPKVIEFDDGEYLETAVDFKPSITVYDNGIIKNGIRIYNNVTEMITQIFKIEFTDFDNIDPDVFRKYCKGQLDPIPTEG